MSKVKFTDLKSRKVRKVINSLDFEQPIEIYNVTNETSDEVNKILVESFNEVDKTIDIKGEIVLVKLLKVLTNIDLDLDIEKDKDLIMEILKSPSELLLQVTDELTEVVREQSNRLIKTMTVINNMSDEELKKLIPITQEDEKEKKKRELIEQLKALEEEK